MATKESTISATAARVHFGEVMKRVENDETLIVERSGQPRVVIMSMDEYRRLREEPSDRASLNERILKAQERYLREAADATYDVEEDIRQMREERSVELDDRLR